jgi:hypothetical protein
MIVNNRNVKFEGLRCFKDIFLGLRVHSLARKKKIESLGCIQHLHGAGGDTVEIAHASFPLRSVTQAIFRQDGWRCKCVIDDLEEQLAREIHQRRHGVVCSRVVMVLCCVQSTSVYCYASA